MKRTLVIIFICCISQIVASQSTVRDLRCVRIRSEADTTNIQFKEIFEFWENYQDDLYRNQFYNADIDVSKYWAKSEIISYNNNPDMILNTYPYYNIFPELVIGIEMRNDTLFEIKSLYLTEPNKPNSEVYLCFSVYVIKNGDSYFLYNKFSENKKNLKHFSKDWMHIYYPENYNFCETDALNLFERANKFRDDFNLKETKSINYYLCSTYTYLLNLLGVDLYLDDFVSSSQIREKGWAQTNNRQIFYTQGGESKLHEFIHVFLHDFRNKYTFFNFDEGLCVYFGELVYGSYNFHAKRLKTFLNENPQIDLSINLQYAFLDENRKYYNDTIPNPKTGIDNSTNYHDDTTNYSYMIMGVICELTLEKDGIELLKQMLLEVKNGDEFYDVIEKILGIKRKDINAQIRNFLNNKY